tara:strand:+ start:500 stop:817 length:318 start_codon:yes stop_codon:yes gene_type:complete
LIVLVLLQRSEGGGLGIGQAGGGGGLGDFLSTRSTSNILTKTTSFLALCFFLTSFSLVLISNNQYKKESIIDSSEDSIIDRLDLIPEEFDVEKEKDEEELSVPSE